MSQARWTGGGFAVDVDKSPHPSSVIGWIEPGEKSERLRHIQCCQWLDGISVVPSYPFPGFMLRDKQLVCSQQFAVPR